MNNSGAFDLSGERRTIARRREEGRAMGIVEQFYSARGRRQGYTTGRALTCVEGFAEALRIYFVRIVSEGNSTILEAG